MSGGDLINIHPSELKFPFELNKQSSCSMQLANKTDQYVAFKVKTTNPKKYCVRPNTGIVLPGSTCDVTVTMQAQKEAPPDRESKDKFLLQSVAAPHGTAAKDITPDMFNKEAGKVMGEFKLRVVYVPANPPSPVPEGSEEGSSPRASVLENGNQNNVLFDASTRSGLEANHTRSMEGPRNKSSEALSIISKLTEEKTSAMQKNQKLRQELELMKNEISKSRAGGFSFLFVLLVGLLGILVGYLVKKT
ncbi:vesicle-associated protein 1-3-like isoform X1 [Telopea speciosissima]|uniref:vesicle-associated protein 1-3-like isoform X1 n=1 Tax=Telopea speciosissima TaxID=54955 RepID=UPI001CC65F73|nr:vesicle-associated protein 1-3-like isoform X1 [Telopea speciosissima]XP_043716362.1 vesicle-associated protein 1-3-like isoform X1 [Telopea speciosissima]XP_043716371.1 vesicle-associated protein 1-3-like isoform X1 [Telopea speciosissima]XP_043716379.1 vesicle-associated protein 1-3-like isoform X1 [Telopea speciosissima]